MKITFQDDKRTQTKHAIFSLEFVNVFTLVIELTEI